MLTEFINFLIGNLLYFVFFIFLIINVCIIIIYLLSFLLSFYDKKNYKKRKKKEINFIEYWFNEIKKIKKKEERKKLFFAIMPFVSKRQKKIGLYCILKNSSKNQMKKYFKNFIISLITFIALFLLYYNYDNYNINKHKIEIYNNINNEIENPYIIRNNNVIELVDKKESSKYIFIINDSNKIIKESREIILPELLFKIFVFGSLIFFVIMKYISKIIL